MQYDIKLRMNYDYADGVGGGRHQIRVLPLNLPGVQRVVAAALSFSPQPAERSDFVDFFENNVTSVAYRSAHESLSVQMTARVMVARPEPGFDVSPTLADLKDELLALLSLVPLSPHHFLAGTPFAVPNGDMTGYAAESLSPGRSVAAIAHDLCHRIHTDFTYDGEATTVTTNAAQAFELKSGVCQDFSHVMIAGLRGLGIPAGYVSGFLRTIPPAGKERLEGADAMHAWVKVWCGREAGWIEFDPTNDMRASNDHIIVGYGRDYSDVSPIVGVLKTTGGQAGEQLVDVIPVT
ncbi:transglutaminase family protein [Oryzicola mucosus]|uniref:Transglutaminase family protein n=1 Tax=Oryzicola mucosus TaxID=2767425 RepID=A0A8J6PMX3_9HYPH|nr:transglutaminase family protein [Oryzicola mucosus]MBD0414667.1 transglutaminase family protein [Oryzicola mucosus]